MSILALCPSRGRPAAARATLDSFRETVRDPGSRLVFVLDEDDPTARKYPKGHVHLVPPGGCMGDALRAAGSDPDVLGGATSVGMIGDDNRFRTPGWDVILDGHLTEHIGFAYGDDGLQHERLPTSWWISRKIVDAFGMTHPSLRHFYMDNWALELGQAAGCIRYFPDVVIEHLHPLAGKAPEDAIYDRARQFASPDRKAFHNWRKLGLPGDAARLRVLLDEGRRRRVLADWHHPALWESLSILFEDRFGWELYTMGGLEWTRHGWELRNGTPGWEAEDYLCPDGAVDKDTHAEVRGAEYPDRPRKLVTWDQASEMRWDFVLSSVTEHQRPFHELARQFGARPIHQVGNARNHVDRSLRQVVLASAAVRSSHKSTVRYHQEFSRDLFGPRPPTNPHRVTSFMLRRDSASCPSEWIEPEVEWREVGGSSPRDPAYLAPMARVADALADTGWVWHDKRIGDGYGHVVWTAASMGRPLIGHASHYGGLLAEPLWRDLRTCIDLDRHPPTEALRLWRAITSDPDWYGDIVEGMQRQFAELVDFDAEAEAIRTALA